MNSIAQKAPAEIKRMVNRYNMTANLLWTILNLAPISIFCYTLMSLKLLYIFLAVSCLTAFLPRFFFDRIQVGKTTAIYKKLGVKIINRYAQNGDIINNLVRKKYPQYKVIFAKKSIKSIIDQTYIFEKFHFALFVFFIAVTFYACLIGRWLWVVIFLITNVIYNVYPNLLQQYIRLKLTIALRRQNLPD